LALTQESVTLYLIIQEIAPFAPYIDQRWLIYLRSHFKHLFFECDATKDRQSALVRKYFPEILPMTENEKLQFWMIGRVKNKLNFFTLFSVLAFQFLIWQMKLRKELKYFSTLEQNWLYMLDTTFKQSKKIRDARLQINYSICRRWRHGDG